MGENEGVVCASSSGNENPLALSGFFPEDPLLQRKMKDVFPLHRQVDDVVLQQAIRQVSQMGVFRDEGIPLLGKFGNPCGFRITVIGKRLQGFLLTCLVVCTDYGLRRFGQVLSGKDHIS